MLRRVCEELAAVPGQAACKGGSRSEAIADRHDEAPGRLTSGDVRWSPALLLCGRSQAAADPLSERIRVRGPLARRAADRTARALTVGAVAARIVLLRGVNVGAHNRIGMPELRELLEGAGFPDVPTYAQSGPV